MSIRTDIRETLEADATLTGILTGGIYDASELPIDGLTASAVPSAYTGVRLNPCAVLRFRNETETEITGHSRRWFFEIYFYQNVGQDQIDLAKARCRVLLHRAKQFTTDGENGQVYYVTWVENSGDLVADELNGAAMAFSRYYVDYLE